MKNIVLKHTGFNEIYGIAGDATNLTLKGGQILQVGDVVEIKDKKHNVIYGKKHIVKDGDRYFVMGLKGVDFKNGESAYGKWEVELYKKFYDLGLGEVDNGIELIEEDSIHTITIDGKEINLSEESYQELRRQLL